MIYNISDNEEKGALKHIRWFWSIQGVELFDRMVGDSHDFFKVNYQLC